MDEVVREGECALCGVVLPFDNECVCVFVGPEACLPYHQWCWDTVSERVVYVRRRPREPMTVVDLAELGLFRWTEEGGESSKDDADDGAQGAVVDASSDTGGSAPPESP
jgi:hypothetical protein